MPSSSGSAKLRKSSRQSVTGGRQLIGSVQWMFSNTARRRVSYLPTEIQKRNFFGMGEIIGVLTNPAETVRSLTESKRLLDEARREINESRERAQIRTKHTFSRLPGFFPRKAEMRAIERALEGDPSFTVLFGASSVGKTALLREVLSRDTFHVLHFDLRMAGFADLPSLYMSLSHQMEQYFEEIADKMNGYEQFEREAWSFKHDRLNVERRIGEAQEGSGVRKITTSDIARLMELFQSSLLKYWEFEPCVEGSKRNNRDSGSTHSDRTRVETTASKSRWSFRRRPKARTSQPDESEHSEKTKEKSKPPPKKMPVIFFDEAHKLQVSPPSPSELPALIQSTDAMKCLLDSMLVLTKQDRLCHVIHATSDPFYQTWLRQLNVMQHCKIITIGDCSKSETKKFYRERLLPRVPDYLRSGLDFESLYEAFGGKFAHWQDYITDYVNANGYMTIKQSSHFLQAHALLNLHIIHSSQSSSLSHDNERGDAIADKHTSIPSADSIHPGLGAAGFKIYSPITNPVSPSSPTSPNSNNRTFFLPEFSAMELLKVMSRLAAPGATSLSYFMLCRELGVRAVDGMVKGRVLDLRWTEPVTNENSDGRVTRPVSTVAVHGQGHGPDGSTTVVDAPIGTFGTAASTEEGDMVAISEQERDYLANRYWDAGAVEVVAEYEDTGSVSEYASMTDVDEY
ncbi:uncharacterized protein EV420DRAFT_1542266 [Desarmillaria tabescens]|uniref:ATPase domain-containing protein n=1 Tax=Armillaria tabescens TaxID=1929756 RepID=A0AA39KC49_ARMTA|nr:uncharacterized protein EV420DRAFT_1542266 [Desarmillaria tabescens]KAK0458444.1 hypothetical protein EV420DRAFT_1542266 [Desarmillaria tabescens]